jgi:hypothetical protein
MVLWLFRLRNNHLLNFSIILGKMDLFIFKLYFSLPVTNEKMIVFRNLSPCMLIKTICAATWLNHLVGWYPLI